MIVELIAATVAIEPKMPAAGWQPYSSYDPPVKPETSADQLAEFAGRLCYQSWDRPNPATATNQLYLANILMQQHFSVLEHASATFYVAGVSRSLTHELVRHRHLSFSQVSQRYVDEKDFIFVAPPDVSRAQLSVDAVNLAQYATDVREMYVNLVALLVARGATRKEARQAARCVLPNATETKLVVSGNMRAWRDVIVKRNSVHADKEIAQFARMVLRHLIEIAPNTFQDM